jgi:hypothetical protein
VSAPVSCNKTRCTVAVIIKKTLTKGDLEMFCFIWDQDQVTDFFLFLFLCCSSEF